jgi:hypothetical protein
VVSAGIPRLIAQRPLLLGALALAATLGAAAPASADAPDLLGAVPAQTAQSASGAVGAVPPTPVQPAVDAVAPATSAVRQAVEAAARPVEHVRDGGPLGGGGAGPAGAAATGVDSASADTVRAVDTAVGDATERGPLAPAAGEVRRRTPLAGDLHPGAALDDALRALGDTLRAVVPLDSLAGPLLGGAGLGRLTGSLFRGSAPALSALTTPVPSPGAGSAVRAPDAATGAPAGVPRQNARPFLQSASALPPAAEAGGRPSSLPPRKVPAPAAGGAATPAPGGFLSGPFLALLVLAALAAPRLMRRLDAAVALLRPSPFVCALERPG